MAAVFRVHYKTTVTFTGWYIVGYLGKICTISLLEAHIPTLPSPKLSAIYRAHQWCYINSFYPADANVLLNAQALNCNNEGLKYLQQNMEYFEQYHRRNNLTHIPLGT